MKYVLETERLILRNYNVNDLEDYYEWASLPDVGPRAGWKAYTDKNKALEWLKEATKKELLFAIELKDENKVIGSIEIMDTFRKNRYDNLNPNKNSKELGCVLSSKYWRKGYMSEALFKVIEFCFETLGVEEIYTSASSKNIQSNGLQEKCGLKLVNIIKENHNFLGEMSDTMQRRLTKEEYFLEKEKGYSNLKLN